MAKVIEKIKNTAHGFLDNILAVSDGELSRKVMLFLCVLLAQMFILLRVCFSGAGTTALGMLGLVLLMDAIGLLLRIATKFKASPVIAYAPAAIFTFGAGMQAVMALYRKEYDDAISARVSTHVLFALVGFAIIFFTYDYISEFMRGRHTAFILGAVVVLVYLATALFGKRENGATLSLFGFQAHELCKVLLVFVFGSVFASKRIGDPAKITLSFVLLSACAIPLVLMNEFGTLLVLIIVYILTLIMLSDREGVFYSIKKLVHNKKAMIGILIFVGLAALLLLIFHKPVSGFFEEIIGRVESKYNERIRPWLGLSVDEHKNAISLAFKRGGLFGIGDIRHMAHVPVVRQDATFCMIAQLYGQIGAVVFLAVFSVFSLLSQYYSSRIIDPYDRTFSFIASLMTSVQAFTAICSATGVLPIIGITTPLVSSGGTGYICQFMLIAIVTKNHYNSLTDPRYLARVREQHFSIKERLPEITENFGVLRQNIAAFFAKRATKLFIPGVAAILLLLLLAGLIFVNSYVDSKFENVNITPIDRSSWSDTPAEEVNDLPLLSKPYIRNILILGVDYGDNARSDAIMVLSVNKRSNNIALYSLQRDCYVEIPGHNKGKLNSAYNYGGAELMMQTIQNNFRFRLNGFVELNMSGFIDMVNSLDSVSIEITQAEADYIKKDTGISLEAGMARMDPDTALSYVRARKLDSDFGRTERQRKMVFAIGRELYSMVRRLNISDADKALTVMSQAVRTSVTANEFKDLLPSLFIGAVSIFRQDDLTTQRIPFGKHYENIRIDGIDYLEPQLRVNYEYIKEVMFG